LRLRGWTAGWRERRMNSSATRRHTHPDAPCVFDAVVDGLRLPGRPRAPVYVTGVNPGRMSIRNGIRVSIWPLQTKHPSLATVSPSHPASPFRPWIRCGGNLRMAHWRQPLASGRQDSSKQLSLWHPYRNPLRPRLQDGRQTKLVSGPVRMPSTVSQEVRYAL